MNLTLLVPYLPRNYKAITYRRFRKGKPLFSIRLINIWRIGR